MKNDYHDVTERLGSPLWWDEYGVPRYDAFAPDLCDAYATECALVRIACQQCDERFAVCISRSRYSNVMGVPFPTSLAEEIRRGIIHYGDPPPHAGCLAGATMNCIDLEVLEFWVKDKVSHEWTRAPSLEGDLPLPDWAKRDDGGVV